MIQKTSILVRRVRILQLTALFSILLEEKSLDRIEKYANKVFFLSRGGSEMGTKAVVRVVEGAVGHVEPGDWAVSCWGRSSSSGGRVE